MTVLLFDRELIRGVALAVALVCLARAGVTLAAALLAAATPPPPLAPVGGADPPPPPKGPDWKWWVRAALFTVGTLAAGVALCYVLGSTGDDDAPDVTPPGSWVDQWVPPAAAESTVVVLAEGTRPPPGSVVLDQFGDRLVDEAVRQLTPPPSDPESDPFPPHPESTDSESGEFEPLDPDDSESGEFEPPRSDSWTSLLDSRFKDCDPAQVARLTPEKALRAMELYDNLVTPGGRLSRLDLEGVRRVKSHLPAAHEALIRATADGPYARIVREIEVSAEMIQPAGTAWTRAEHAADFALDHALEGTPDAEVCALLTGDVLVEEVTARLAARFDEVAPAVFGPHPTPFPPFFAGPGRLDPGLRVFLDHAYFEATHRVGVVSTRGGLNHFVEVFQENPLARPIEAYALEYALTGQPIPPDALALFEEVGLADKAAFWAERAAHWVAVLQRPDRAEELLAGLSFDFKVAWVRETFLEFERNPPPLTPAREVRFVQHFDCAFRAWRDAETPRTGSERYRSFRDVLATFIQRVYFPEKN